jgi:hypothetical protein
VVTRLYQTLPFPFIEHITVLERINMKRRFIFIVIAFLLIIGFLIYRSLEFDITNTNYVLVGDNNGFNASVVTDGQDIFYMWNNRLQHITSGSMDIDVFYVGEKEYGPGTEISYEIGLGALGGGGDFKPDEDVRFDPHIISSSTTNFLRTNPDDFIITVTIDEDDYIIHFYEQ